MLQNFPYFKPDCFLYYSTGCTVCIILLCIVCCRDNDGVIISWLTRAANSRLSQRKRAWGGLCSGAAY